MFPWSDSIGIYFGNCCNTVHNTGMKNRPKNKSEFVHIGSVINNVFKTYRKEPDAELIHVWNIWDRIVGAVVAQNARPAAFKGNLLLVHVSSSPWIQQLQFLKKDIISKLNQALNKELEFEIVKATSAFLNTNGGRLFIGIDDDGNTLGLSSDYKTIGKKNKDGFQLHLINVLTKYLTKDYFKFIKISVIDYHGEEVCVLQISKSDLPAFVKKDGKDRFFIRVAASSQSLSVQETVNYIRNHWES